jgi:PAS domain S-box-containing protein
MVLDGLLAASILLPLAVFGMVAADDRGQTLTAARRDIVTTLDTLHGHAEKVLEFQSLALGAIDESLRTLTPDEVRGRADALHDHLAALRRHTGSLIGLLIIDTDGGILVDSERPVPPTGINVADRAYFRRHVDDPSTAVAVSAPLVSRADGSSIFFVTRRWTAPDGAFAGVLASGIREATWLDQWRQSVPDPGSLVSLLRDDGAIIARRPALPAERASVVSPEAPLSRAIRDGAERVVLVDRSPMDGTERLFAFRRLRGFPLTVVHGRPVEAVLAPWRGRLAIYGAAASLAGLALLSLAVLARRNAASLGREVEERRRAETVVRSLVADLEHRVAERTRTIRESEERLRLAQDAGGIGSWDWNVATGTLHWSESCHRLHGTDPAVAPTIDGWLSLIHDEDRARIAGDLAAVAGDGSRLWAAGLCIVRPSDGEVRRLSSRGEIVRDGEGRLQRMIGVVTDVTERQRAEERQSLLANEVEHRARNALSVVLSLIRLTPGEDVASFVDAVEGRIGAMVRAHALLAEERWEGADLRTVVAGELAAYGANADLSGPRVRLRADAAQPLSMVVHELATNAAKHGALSAPGGRVTVRWEEVGPDRTLRIRWVEDGGPPVAGPPGDPGFGSRLMRALVGDQLRGAIALEWRPEGLRCTILVPAHMPASEAAHTVALGPAFPNVSR